MKRATGEKNLVFYGNSNLLENFKLEIAMLFIFQSEQHFSQIWRVDFLEMETFKMVGFDKKGSTRYLSNFAKLWEIS